MEVGLMSIRCKDLMELPSLQKLKLVAGRDGLDRVVRWVHVADVPQVTDWVQGGELLFITGIGIKKGTGTLLELIDSVQKKKLSGLVINVGPYIQEIPEEAIKLADSSGFPVFSLPWEVKLVEVTADICRTIILKQMEEKSLWDLVENILFGPMENQEIIIDRAAYYGYDLTNPHQVAIVDVDDFASYLKEAGIRDEKRVLEIKMLFHQIIQEVLGRHKCKALSVLHSDSVIIILPIKGNEERLNKILTEDIKESMSSKIPGMTVSIGLGNSSLWLKDLKESLIQAEQALAVAKMFKGRNQTLYYKEIGYYKLLFKMGHRTDLEEFFLETLGDLLTHDKNHGGELLSTLNMYLEENGNLARTIERLYVHRNTLKYRLEKIENLTGRSLGNAQDRLNLQMGLAVGRFLNMWTK
ncbi:MAG: PucR family transcriptional regulator ligand-binding domain-containing protein [Desulfitobacteriaceae bacterium]|nr:PucR family transcriptional regulator ligand-binding domain-containing protein [Desulfitobacteriaceae bacterium]